MGHWLQPLCAVVKPSILACSALKENRLGFIDPSGFFSECLERPQFPHFPFQLHISRAGNISPWPSMSRLFCAWAWWQGANIQLQVPGTSDLWNETTGTARHRGMCSSRRQTQAWQFCDALLAQITSVATHRSASLSTPSGMMRSRGTCYFPESYFGHEEISKWSRGRKLRVWQLIIFQGKTISQEVTNTFYSFRGKKPYSLRILKAI